MEKQPIEELKDVVLMVIHLVDAAYLASQDGKLEWDDMTHIFSILKDIGPAFSGINKVPGEITDLSAEEISELCKLIEEEVTVVPEKQKPILSKILACVKASYDLYLEIRGN